MRLFLIAALVAVCLGSGARAQPIGNGGGSYTTSTIVSSAVTGFGTLSATNSSAALSTLTTGPNSAVWPTTPGVLNIVNSPSSAGIAYLCPLAGTCSATVGIPVSPGFGYSFYQPVTTMTVFAASTATLVAQW